MYHYLKWAALSLFFRRNLRYLLLILFSVIGIYAIDGIYHDLVDYAIATGRKGSILYFLAGKWVLVTLLSILFVYSVMHLGFGKESVAAKKEKKKRRDKVDDKKANAQEELVMQRLEKFKSKGRLKRRSDLVLERLEKERKKK
ncbi:hypothetical protein [Nitratifractor sp.]